MIFPSYYDTLYFGWNTDLSICCAFTQEELKSVFGSSMFFVKIRGFMGLNTLKGNISKTVGFNAISDKDIVNAFIMAVRRHSNSMFVCVGYNKRTNCADILDLSDSTIEQHGIISLLEIDRKLNLGIIKRASAGIMLKRFDGKVHEIKG